jgi:hypothetical protein
MPRDRFAELQAQKVHSSCPVALFVDCNLMNNIYGWGAFDDAVVIGITLNL